MLLSLTTEVPSRTMQPPVVAEFINSCAREAKPKSTTRHKSSTSRGHLTTCHRHAQDRQTRATEIKSPWSISCTRRTPQLMKAPAVSVLLRAKKADGVVVKSSWLSGRTAHNPCNVTTGIFFSSRGPIRSRRGRHPPPPSWPGLESAGPESVVFLSRGRSGPPSVDAPRCLCGRR